MQRRFLFTRQSAARSVARKMTEDGCRSVTIRNPGGTRQFWSVDSTAMYPVPGDDPKLLSPFIQQETHRLAALARGRGGMLLHCTVRTSPDDDPAAATMPLPDPLPLGPPQPPPAPAWADLHFGDPGTEVSAAIDLARRMYATVAPPSTLLHLTDDELAQETLDDFTEADGTRHFLMNLVQTAHHLPAADSGTRSIIPLVTELAGSPAMSPGARASLLLLLLDCVCEQDVHAADNAEWAALTGKDLNIPSHMTAQRDEVVARVPALLSRWHLEGDAVRWAISALAAYCPTRTAASVRPRLADIPAPQGTGRADILALMDAMLAEDTHALQTALARLATWQERCRELLDNPHVPPSLAARAALAHTVARELGADLWLC
ncbi:hypothetical protein [Streptomyces sp. MJP52]|uniref:hypothetical protein n=1 Tax=Streptomyces sp. MJP52 TaxID=2940555 RepID=UPI002472FA74|nr:hypothetical protein [Streptomyces sp. MJP52]